LGPDLDFAIQSFYAGEMVQKSLHCFNMLWTDCLLIGGVYLLLHGSKEDASQF
jgi:hypothetical protein